MILNSDLLIHNICTQIMSCVMSSQVLWGPVRCPVSRSPHVPRYQTYPKNHAGLCARIYEGVSFHEQWCKSELPLTMPRFWMTMHQGKLSGLMFIISRSWSPARLHIWRSLLEKKDCSTFVIVHARLVPGLGHASCDRLCLVLCLHCTCSSFYKTTVYKGFFFGNVECILLGRHENKFHYFC